MHLTIEERTIKKEEFFRELGLLYHVVTFESSNDARINSQFEKVLSLLSHFRMDMLPYSAASKFIYEINDEGVEHFFEYLEELLMDRFKNLEHEEVYIKAIKLIEHLDLATSQKAYLFKKQEQELINLSLNISDVVDVLKQYETSKTEIERSLAEFTEFKKDFTKFTEYFDGFEEKFSDFQEKFEKIEKSTEQITVNLISILGIFAAILLGAYGSIQGFSNVFANAKDMSLGKLIMVSSIGGSSVLLILFFLLSSIARLTDRKFGSEGVGFIEKHPIMFYSHGLLAIIFSFGLVVEVISKGLKPDFTWLWLSVPILVLIQMLYIKHTKSLWGIMHRIKIPKKISREMFLFFVCIGLGLTVLAFLFGYI